MDCLLERSWMLLTNAYAGYGRPTLNFIECFGLVRSVQPPSWTQSVLKWTMKWTEWLRTTVQKCTATDETARVHWPVPVLYYIIYFENDKLGKGFCFEKFTQKDRIFSTGNISREEWLAAVNLGVLPRRAAGSNLHWSGIFWNISGDNFGTNRIQRLVLVKVQYS